MFAGDVIHFADHFPPHFALLFHFSGDTSMVYLTIFLNHGQMKTTFSIDIPRKYSRIWNLAFRDRTPTPLPFIQDTIAARFLFEGLPLFETIRPGLPFIAIFHRLLILSHARSADIFLTFVLYLHWHSLFISLGGDRICFESEAIAWEANRKWLHVRRIGDESLWGESETIEFEENWRRPGVVGGGASDQNGWSENTRDDSRLVWRGSATWTGSSAGWPGLYCWIPYQATNNRNDQMTGSSFFSPSFEWDSRGRRMSSDHNALSINISLIRQKSYHDLQFIQRSSSLRIIQCDIIESNQRQ
jgi:hypothetical protein